MQMKTEQHSTSPQKLVFRGSYAPFTSIRSPNDRWWWSEKCGCSKRPPLFLFIILWVAVLGTLLFCLTLLLPTVSYVVLRTIEV
jgi:hypothetical protein